MYNVESVFVEVNVEPAVMRLEVQFAKSTSLPACRL